MKMAYLKQNLTTKVCPGRLFNDEKTFISTSTDYVLKIIQLNSKKKSQINIALSGGSTPQPIYKALAKKLPTLPIVHFYQVDERYVPADHPDSNQKMIRTTLKPKNFHYFDTSLPIKKSLQKYSKELPKSFDLTILGIGEDGHTASLFPNTKALTTKSQVAHTTTRKFSIKDRLTITFPTILKSKNILVLLKNKAKIIKELQNPTKSKEKFPALKLLDHKNLQVFTQQN